MSKKKIKFMCTAFRDGFQSVYGARVFTKDFLPAVEAASDAGIDWFEAGGGARFQSLFFYCNENAFDMMDSFRKAAGPDADLQTLARGVNVVGLDSQSSDMIKLHADLFKKHGISSIRNFDALNDVNNLIYSGKCIVDAGLKHQVSVTMMELPPGCEGAHDPKFYADTLQKILDAEIQFDSVCFKDASGTSTPAKVFETIKLAKSLAPEGTHIHFHTHETAGTGVTAMKAAIEAGADGIDLSMAPCSGGTCQPDILTMWHALRGTDYYLDVDIEKVLKAEDVFKDCMKDYFLPPEATAVEPLIPWSPMPGGALTANTQMLRDNNIMDKYPEIIRAMGDVVRAGGYGTSVTPVSQFYFQQAFNNVMFGQWKKIAEGYGKMVLGYFGKTPVEPDPEIVKLASEQLKLEPTTKTPIEINDEDPEKGVEQAKKLLIKEGIEVNDENIFIVGACKDKGIKFLQGKATIGVRKKEAEKPAQTTSSESGSYTVSVDGTDYAITINNNTTTVDGKAYTVDLRASDSAAAPAAASESKATGTITPIKAQMPGQVIKIVASEGQEVNEGDTILVLEAMKMEMDVNSHISGTVTKIVAKEGAQVAAEDLLAENS
ncbi:biotin attachment protein [bacterium B17]|nr:biotin attachment protein [bacterium B17]